MWKTVWIMCITCCREKLSGILCELVEEDVKWKNRGKLSKILYCIYKIVERHRKKTGCFFGRFWKMCGWGMHLWTENLQGRLQKYNELSAKRVNRGDRNRCLTVIKKYAIFKLLCSCVKRNSCWNSSVGRAADS